MRKIINFILFIILIIAIIILILIKNNLIEIKFIKHNEKTIDEYINNGLSLDDPYLSNSTWKENRFYYNQLDTYAKIIYDRIMSEKEHIYSGYEQIDFGNEFDSLLRQENGMEIISTAYQNAADAIRYDNMDFFTIDLTKMALKTITYTRGNSKTFKVYLGPLEEGGDFLYDGIRKSDIYIMNQEVEKALVEILSGASGTNYQKIKYIHDWLIDNIEYDTSYQEENNRNIYGALVNKKVVCEGYSKAFKYLMDRLEIPCIIVSGDAISADGIPESHMWNYVMINDVWYSIDVTWDDPIVLNGGELSNENKYKYFCQGDNINKNHVLNNKITENGQEYNYPELYHKE